MPESLQYTESAVISNHHDTHHHSLYVKCILCWRRWVNNDILSIFGTRGSKKGIHEPQLNSREPENDSSFYKWLTNIPYRIYNSNPPSLQSLLFQVLHPLLLGPPAADTVFHHAIHNYSRAYVHAHQSRHFNQHLEVVCDGIANI